jgi:Carboxypeptidase regulatory-like domain
MKKATAFLLLVCLWLAPIVFAQTPSLRGTVKDPSGAAVPGATVQLTGTGREQRKTTDLNGQFSFPSLAPGQYQVRVTAKGFAPVERPDLEITRLTVFDAQLAIQTQEQEVTVAGQTAGTVSIDPASNAGALVLGQKELAALSDDPDELEQQLQAMAGPGAGPNGGQIYIDGFTGGQMPPKSSIREVRINTNPFSPEYDKPGFGRIEIFTKPGTDFLRGQVFFQYNNQDLDARSPLLTQSNLPPYDQRFVGGSVSGPLKKDRASFSVDFDQRNITENAFVLATTLDSNLNPQSLSQAVATPQTRTSITPRIDYMLDAANTLTLRYQYTRIEADNQGVGSYDLSSTAYNERTTENTLQATETAILSPSAVTETRFQYQRTGLIEFGAGSSPQINVDGAFVGGSATIGNSGSLGNHFELSNNTTYTHKTQIVEIGLRAREAFDSDTSRSNFNGTFTFLGGTGPVLDSNNQPIAGTSVALTALQVYQRTLLFESEGLSGTEIRALGGGATQFSLTTGVPTTNLNGFDLGIYANDDWRLRPNLTLSYGLRYETQNNISDHADFAPRAAVAWGIGGKGGRGTRTVLRAGAGVFYDRFPNTCASVNGSPVTNCVLNALRYNGTTQESYLIQNPDFFPNIPTAAALAATQQPQTIQLLSSNLRAPQTYQANIGLERQINSHARISINYIGTRGVHLIDTRDINAPINGVYPFGDPVIRDLTESAGVMRMNQLIVSPNVSYKGLFLFGFYNLSYGMDDNEGQPANPYNLRAEWGPSTYADIRHRGIVGTNIPLLWKISIAPFIVAQSGTPYDIITGLDPLGTGYLSARPALLQNVSAASCTGGSLIYEAAFGCFDLNPSPGEPVIERNYGRGPGMVSVNMRLSRTWSFGRRGESGPAGAQNGPPPAPGTPGGPPPPGGPGGPSGGGPGGPGGGGPPPGLFGGTSSGLKYNLTLAIMANNAINHVNYAAPSGDLSSPYFGDYRSLAGNFGPIGSSSAYNRRVSIQLRFTF